MNPLPAVAEPNQPREGVRLDKWLWAARFFKTRSMAAEAISGGKIQVNQARGKPARILREGDTLQIRKGPYTYTVLVRGLTTHRGPASQAARLYEETEDSRQQRERLAEERRALAASLVMGDGRPSKRDRRRIIRFTRKKES